jgi:hypothetical protein
MRQRLKRLPATFQAHYDVVPSPRSATFGARGGNSSAGQPRAKICFGFFSYGRPSPRQTRKLFRRKISLD